MRTIRDGVLTQERDGLKAVPYVKMVQNGKTAPAENLNTLVPSPSEKMRM